MYEGQEKLDGLVWDIRDIEAEDGLKQMRRQSTYQKIQELATDQLKRTAILAPPHRIGGYNILYRLRVDGRSSEVMLRVPWPSLVKFPADKTVHEAATVSFLAQNTKLPLSSLVCHGHDVTIGPFLILEYVGYHTTLLQRMKSPNEDRTNPAVINLSIPMSTLAKLWYHVARCQLQLFQITLPRIGSLVETKRGGFEVADRPITHSMNSLLRLANIPVAIFPPKGKTYGSADEWYMVLAKQHLAVLVFQQNDVIKSADDCRNKYVMRQILRRLARQGKLSTFGFGEDTWSAQSAQRRQGQAPQLSPIPSGTKSFRLWGDDFRAGNILLDKADEIVALIDWEYTYSAPTQFSLDPPWWLLLRTPETWSGGMDSFKETYEAYLNTWLSAMEKAEVDGVGGQPFPFPLSRYMRESWDTGRFWLNHALRSTRALDAIYWRYLDERFFGPRPENITQDDLWKTRLDMLNEEEIKAMEELVKRKMADMKDRRIVDWAAAEAQAYFAKYNLQ